MYVYVYGDVVNVNQLCDFWTRIYSCYTLFELIVFYVYVYLYS